MSEKAYGGQQALDVAEAHEIKIFCSYAQVDQPYRKMLETHLAPLKRRYELSSWSEHNILPGVNMAKETERNLNSADLIFLLISPEFMDSDYRINKEVRRALARHRQGEALVIPVLVRPAHWDHALFGHLQPLPSDKRPVTSWSMLDDAFFDVVTGVQRVLDSLLATRKANEWVKRGDTLRSQHQQDQTLAAYEEALKCYDKAAGAEAGRTLAFYGKGCVLESQGKHTEAIRTLEQALLMRPEFARAFNQKGLAHYALRQFAEALQAFELAICYRPDFGQAYNNLGNVHQARKHYHEAIQAFDQAIQLEPAVAARAWSNKGMSLHELGDFTGTLEAYKQALLLQPDFANAYNHKGITLEILERPEEALQAFEQALSLDPTLASALSNKAYALISLQRYENALQACEQALRLNDSMADAYNNKGIALLKIDKYMEAIDAFDQAIQRAPHLKKAYNNKAISLEKQGRFDEAQRVFAQARELSQ